MPIYLVIMFVFLISSGLLEITAISLSTAIICENQSPLIYFTIFTPGTHHIYDIFIYILGLLAEKLALLNLLHTGDWCKYHINTMLPGQICQLD